jgi:hypothetical protein
MARIRSIKPEFWSSLDVAALSRDARLLFIGLWNYVDDEGREIADPRLVKAAVFPLDDDMDSSRLRRLLDELSRGGQIRLYEADGKPLMQIVAWHHQKIDRLRKSRHPRPSDQPEQEFDEGSTKPRRSLDEASSPDLGILGSRDLGIGSRDQPLRAEPICKSGSQDTSNPTTELALVPVKVDYWTPARDATTAEWPDASDPKRKGFAGEIVKVAKRTGHDPARLVRLAAAVMRLQHTHTVDALTNPARSAMCARLGELLALDPSPTRLEHRWNDLARQPRWPADIGTRMQRLIEHWTDEPETPAPTTTAGDRQRAHLGSIAARLATITGEQPERPKRPDIAPLPIEAATRQTTAESEEMENTA